MIPLCASTIFLNRVHFFSNVFPVTPEQTFPCISTVKYTHCSDNLVYCCTTHQSPVTVSTRLADILYVTVVILVLCICSLKSGYVYNSFSLKSLKLLKVFHFQIFDSLYHAREGATDGPIFKNRLKTKSLYCHTFHIRSPLHLQVQVFLRRKLCGRVGITTGSLPVVVW